MQHTPSLFIKEQWCKYSKFIFIFIFIFIFVVLKVW